MTGDSSAENWQPIEWKHHPSAGIESKIWVIAAVSVMTGLGVYAFSRNSLMATGSIGLIWISTADFWLGSKFSLKSDVVTVRKGISLLEMKWEDVKSVSVSGNSVKLSPLLEGNKLENIRGVTLLLPEGERQRILEVIKGRLGEDVRFLER